jgi:translation initiation factor 2-alpha kinase 1
LCLELELVGRGGYGSVYRARNRIDGQEYAIKKVKLKGTTDDVMNGFRSDANDKLIREVKTFARISNHPNVVRYHAAWAEPVIDDEIQSEEEPDLQTVFETPLITKKRSASFRPFKKTSLDPFDVSRESSFPGSQVDGTPSLAISTSFHSDSTHVDFIDTSTTSNMSPIMPAQIAEQQLLMQKPSSQKHDRHRSLRSFGHHDVSGGQPVAQSAPNAYQHPFNAALKSKRDGRKTVAKKNKVSAILYIQMQLCPYNDLRRWLIARNENGRVDIEENVSIFRQIVQGLDHIHRKGFVHRDLKPEVKICIILLNFIYINMFIILYINVFMKCDSCLEHFYPRWTCLLGRFWACKVYRGPSRFAIAEAQERQHTFQFLQ